MKELRKWQRRFRDIRKIINRAIVENQEEILDLNIAQLESGKDSNDAYLDEYEYDSYAKMKKGPPYNSKAPLGIPNLRLEGDFHEGFIMEPDGDDFNITSTDSKTDRLRDKYGDDIFGLNKRNIGEAASLILEDTLKEIRK